MSDATPQGNGDKEDKHSFFDWQKYIRGNVVVTLAVVVAATVVTFNQIQQWVEGLATKRVEDRAQISEARVSQFLRTAFEKDDTWKMVLSERTNALTAITENRKRMMEISSEGEITKKVHDDAVKREKALREKLETLVQLESDLEAQKKRFSTLFGNEQILAAVKTAINDPDFRLFIARELVLPTRSVLLVAGECPAGWQPYLPAIGRYLLGAGRGKGADAAGNVLSVSPPEQIGGVQKADVSISIVAPPGARKGSDFQWGNTPWAGGPNPVEGGATMTGKSSIQISPPYIALSTCIRAEIGTSAPSAQ